MENKYFNEALSNFARDMANGGAVRHLADLGYTAAQIVREVDYPVTAEQVGKILWQYYLQQGIILLEPPQAKPVIEKVSYVREHGKYGSVHFRRKVEQVENSRREYYPCDFGKKRYQNEALFLKELEILQERDREYILGLPWPLQRVYHAADERMGRIHRSLQQMEEVL